MDPSRAGSIPVVRPSNWVIRFHRSAWNREEQLRWMGSVWVSSIITIYNSRSNSSFGYDYSQKSLDSFEICIPSYLEIFKIIGIINMGNR